MFTKPTILPSSHHSSTHFNTKTTHRAPATHTLIKTQLLRAPSFQPITSKRNFHIMGAPTISEPSTHLKKSYTWALLTALGTLGLIYSNTEGENDS